jgi:Mg-chelatase subunit ChlD
MNGHRNDQTDVSTVLSKTLSFVETEHARLRRKQRGIDKKDLKAAIRFGKCEPQLWGKNRKKDPNVVRYTYNDFVYIVNKQSGKEVTCYAVPLKLTPVPLPNRMKTYHNQAVHKVKNDLDSWTSNTVLVIDTSGSMKTSDIWGSRNRLQSVWLSVALDYLACRLESGGASFTDVVSVVTLGDTPTVLFEEVPTTWVLFNQIVHMYTSNKVPPSGDGNFLPSLTKAEELLLRNSNASCAAALLFLSDGAPSDKGKNNKQSIIEKVESLAKQFGRRLTFTTIGIGDKDDFHMLQEMADAAKDFGAIADFKLPSMTSSSLGEAFTSVATSLTTSQTEMTDLGTSKQRKVRNVFRESRSKASLALTTVSDDDFFFYSAKRATRKVYCEYLRQNGKKDVSYKVVPLQHANAKYVAFAKGPFGEGAERFAYRFFEVAGDGKTILGIPLVAKESRMVLEEMGVADEKARKEFVRTFCTTQQLARGVAEKFNKKLMSNPRIHKNTPQISFLDCSIYELDDDTLGTLSVLVEKKLDHTKWFKWNSNNGCVNGVRKVSQSNGSSPSYANVTGRGINEIATNTMTLDLNKIEEGSEEEEESDEESTKENTQAIIYTPSQVAQAFSHFTYIFSDRNRKRLVCDLQGVFNEELNLLEFSDPVIHYYNSDRSERKGVHGRTDRGRKGFEDFFATHICKEQDGLCQLVTRGFRHPIRRYRPN